MDTYFKVKNGVATREPIPDFLQGLDASSLADLSWTDAALEVRDLAWWPGVDQSPALGWMEAYFNETLTTDPVNKVVRIARDVAPPTAAQISALKAALMAEIDEAVAGRIIKSTRFAMAYEEREKAALAFKAADYTGPVDEWIARFAGNTGMTNTAATNLILGQATGLRAALKTLDNLRMDKYLVLAAATPAAARTKHAQILEQVNAVAIP